MRAEPFRLSPGAAPVPAALNAAVAARLIVVTAIWLLGRPYAGAAGDALIYLGRALADLDPAGVGADPMFRLDGQSRFSLFAPLYARLVGWVGPSDAVRLVSGAALLAWFAAAALLAAQLTRGRLFWASLVLVACLPYAYGPAFALQFGEPLAIPRPLAEAFVLAGLAAGLAGRFAWALAAMIAAAAFHPIMALPGALALYVLICMRDRRWMALAPLALAALLAAAFAGLPLVDRLATRMDAEWLAVLSTRNFYLFPRLWPMEAWATLAAHAATLAVAAGLTRGRARALLLAVLAIGLGGVAVAALLGDRMALVLIAQAQVWRASWLSAALAALVGARVAVALWAGGASGRAVLALLTLAWAPGEPTASLIGAGLAVALRYTPFGPKAVSPRLVWLLWLGVALFVVKWLAEGVLFLPALIAADQPTPWARLAKMHFQAIPLAALAVFWAMRGDGAAPRAVRLAGAAVLAVAVIALWTRPLAPGERAETIRPPQDWARLIASEPGPIFWLGGNGEPWLWFGRANWLADVQGAGLVFSRPQMAIWSERTRFALEAGLARDTMLDYAARATRWPELTPAALARLCARPDRPAWIVAPQMRGLADARPLAVAVWTPNDAIYMPGPDGNRSRIDSFVVARCDADPSTPPAMGSR